MPTRSSFLLVCALLSCTVLGQTKDSPKLRWDVISVKPSAPGDCRPGEGGVQFRPNGLSASCTSTIFLIEFAYRLMDPSRIVGLPKWANGPQTYAVDARVSDEDVAAFGNLPRDQKARMMQSVFAERYGLKAHMETREMPAYSLVVAKGGSKLKTSNATGPSSSQFDGNAGHVSWVNSPLTNLKFLLAGETGRPVVDNTGLTGRYDFTLEYTPFALAGTDDSGRPPLAAALEKQLGLQMVPSKQPVEVLVVDSIRPPTGN